MPLRDPDPSDPNVIVGVEAPGDSESLREMAWAIAEELARTGYDEPRIQEIFDTEFYGNAFLAKKVLGKDEIDRIIHESLRVFGQVRFTSTDATPKPQLVQLGKKKG